MMQSCFNHDSGPYATSGLDYHAFSQLQARKKVGENVARLLAWREISPTVKRPLQRQWGEDAASSISCSGHKREATNAKKALISWLEAESFKHSIARYCPLLPAPRSTIAAAFSPDGKTLASTHGDHTVKIICCQTGVCLKVLSGHRRTPWVVSFHPSRPEVLASGSLDYEVRLWDANTAECIGSRDFYRPIASLAFHAQGDVLAVASGHKLYIWQYTKEGDASAPKIVLRTPRSLRAVHFHPLAAPLLLTAEVNDLDSPDCQMTIATSRGYQIYSGSNTHYGHTTGMNLQTMDANPASNWWTGRSTSQSFPPVTEQFTAVLTDIVSSSGASLPSQSQVAAAEMDISPRPSNVDSTLITTTDVTATSNRDEHISNADEYDANLNYGQTWVDTGGRVSPTIVGGPWDGGGPVLLPESGNDQYPDRNSANLLVASGREQARENDGSNSWPIGLFPNVRSQALAGDGTLQSLPHFLHMHDHASSDFPVRQVQIYPEVDNRSQQQQRTVEESNRVRSRTRARNAQQELPYPNYGPASHSESRVPVTGLQFGAPGVTTRGGHLSAAEAAAARAAVSAGAGASAGAELPCTVKLRLWPYDIKDPSTLLDPETCRLTIPHAVLCSEMGTDFSPCGRFLAACVACVLPPLEADTAQVRPGPNGTSGTYSVQSPTQHPISTQQVIYELRIYSLEEATFGEVLASRAVRAAHCLTSIQFSPTSGHILLAYGRRHGSLLRSVVLDGTSTIPIYTILEVYRVADLRLVRVLPSAEDEVNVACFHPQIGGGLVYGTKEGKLRILHHDWKIWSMQSENDQLLEPESNDPFHLDMSLEERD